MNRARGKTVAWWWAIALAAAVFAVGSYTLTGLFAERFKAPFVVALVLSLVQLGLLATCAGAAVIGVRVAAWLSARLRSRRR